MATWLCYYYIIGKWSIFINF